MIPGSANPLLLAGAAEEAGYAIERSVRFNSADSAYLSRTPASAGNRKTWTWAGWVKRSTTALATLFGVDNGGGTSCGLTFSLSAADSGKLEFFQGATTYRITTQVFRDLSAWMHIVLALDTTLGTATNRVKLYVNGTEVTSFDTNNNPSQNADLPINNTVIHSIGSDHTVTASRWHFNGYLADIHFIDGQALDPTSFGEFDTNGIWQPKAYTGTYGTNGFHLPFSDNSTAAALGTDTSGNSNTWTVNNISNVSGGPTSVASASGALPIYNTTDTYGTTKGTGTRTDSNSSSIALAVPMDGANNGTTFTDESATIRGSGSTKAISVNGNTKTVTTQSKYYGSSGYFDGNGDFLTGSTSADLNMGSGDFTVECWVRWDGTSTPYQNFVGSNSASFTGNATFFRVWGSSASGGLPSKVGIGNPTHDATNSVYSVTSLAINTWTHVAAVRSSGIIRLYINGILDKTGSSDTSTYDFGDNGFCIGASPWDGANGYFAGYIQDLRIYKGVAKYTSNFNPPSSTQNTTIAAGNDSLVDVPTNGTETDTGVGGEVRGNYATLNPLDNGGITLANGNLDASRSTGSWASIRATIGISSGKWYWEATATSGTNFVVGISKSSAAQGTNNYVGVDANGWGYVYDGQKYTNGSGTAYGATYANGDVIGVAFDADAGTLTFYKNNSSQGTAFTGLTSGPYFPAVSNYSSDWTLNFGQRPFAYTAPSGFKALNTANLDAPVVTKPSEYMDVKLYTGNGGTNAITGLSFSPDLVWLKGRSTSSLHNLYDVIRGRKALFSSSTNAELSLSAGVDFGTFNSDGFTLLTPSATAINNSGQTFVAWTWDAGSSTVTNTDGSITSSVRANPSAGFSIVTFNQTTSPETIGHGLGVAPQMIIVKDRDTGGTDWQVYHASIGATNKLLLNLTNSSSSSTIFDNTAPTGTVFSLDATFGLTVAYCFAPVDGYSSFGSYVGNGSSDGPMVYTGFRPRWIMTKGADNASKWVIYDTARETYNLVDTALYADVNYADQTNIYNNIDILSNGFKIRSTWSDHNTSGNDFIYAAFAENPFALNARAR